MLKLVEVEFETKDGIRKANVIGLDSRDVIDFIKGFGGATKIINIGYKKDLHAYTDAAVGYLSEKLNVNVNVEKIEPALNPESSNQTTQEPRYICPWCERGFEKSIGLKMHMKKAHEPKKGSAEEKTIENIEETQS